MFAIIDADGWFGDYTTIYSVHETLEEARKAKRGRRSLRIVEGCHREAGYKMSYGSLQALLQRGDWKEVG